MAKIKTTTYLTKSSHKWLETEAAKQGLSKNDVIQISINKAMEEGQTQPITNSTRHRKGW